RTVQHHRGAYRAEFSNFDVSITQSPLSRREVDRTARANHLDELPLWWSPAVLYLPGSGRRQTLWSAGGRAISRRGIVRVSVVLPTGLRQPAESPASS